MKQQMTKIKNQETNKSLFIIINIRYRVSKSLKSEIDFQNNEYNKSIFTIRIKKLDFRTQNHKINFHKLNF